MSANHKKALRLAVEKAVADYPNSEEGRNFLEAFWASKLDEYKKSEDFQKEVAQVASPSWGMASMPARSSSWLTGPFLPARSSLFWMCRLPMPMLQTFCQNFCFREGGSSPRLRWVCLPFGIYSFFLVYRLYLIFTRPPWPEDDLDSLLGEVATEVG
ncbi:UNVERIFIED_CONTAM: hypothetical protein Slati_2398400 [Sesamum latifolium]|uniref:Uncharacterized protein n=1 Tax=Sesamum latifolium TaxID=2727402 RepID=A0AAW2WCW7_9LAMI